MNPIRLLSRFFRILVLTILAIGAAIASFLYLSRHEPAAITLVTALTDLMFLLVYLILVWTIARFTISLLATMLRYTLDNRAESSTVFISIIISAFISWEEINYLFGRMGTALSQMMSGSIPLITNTVIRLSYPQCGYDDDIPYCLRRNLYDSLNGMVDVFVRPAASFFSSIFQNPQFLLVIFVTFITTYLILNLIFNNRILSKADHIINSGLYNASHLKNIFFFSLILLAGYLSLGSIVVLPVFKEEESPVNFTPEILSTRLQGMTIADSYFRKYHEELEGNESVSEDYDQLIGGVESARSEVAQAQAAAISRSEDIRTQMLKSEIERSNERYRGRIGNLKELYEESTKRFLDAQNHRVTRAINEYEQMYSLPYGSRDKQRYFTTLMQWFQYANGKELGDLEDCFQDVARYRDDLSRTRREHLDALQIIVRTQDDDRRVSRELNRIQQYSLEPVESQIRIRTSCRTRSVYAVPGQPVVGASSLGVIGAASEWLLRTGSVAFTTVMGMLGFGLLGATFSTFIREQRRRGRPASAALVEDLAGAVIRGMSAALVVFLGVYGGLAIIAGGGQPDPYVLFFLCLVGAVFSESVWGWARKKLDEQLTVTKGG